MWKNSDKSGQFIILAAALILMVMVSVVVFLYANLPTTQMAAQNVLAQVNSVESSANKVVAAGASYYSTILNVTGNYTYARQQATALILSGFSALSNLYSYYGFSYTLSKLELRAYWYSSTSYTYAKTQLSFNLTSLGLYGLKTNATQELLVQVVCPPRCDQTNQAKVFVQAEQGKPITDLQPNNFYFESFSNTQQRWIKQPPTQFTNYGNGTYSLGYPGLTTTAYILGVTDQRGIFVLASSYTKVTYTFQGWPQLSQPFIVQIYNNGTLSMLGQPLTTPQNVVPIPPVPVKDILVNETDTSSNNVQVPFQVEDWASGYTVPLGLSNNETLFSGFQMIATMVYPGKTQSLTVYWKGIDSWNQTPYSIPCTTQSGQYFLSSCPKQNSGSINNGQLSVTVLPNNAVDISVSFNNQRANVSFVTVDGVKSYNSGGRPSYTLIPGVVREILQTEPESQSGFGQAYSVYFQLVYLIPANANYIEVFQRAFFVNVPSGAQRVVTQLMFAQIAISMAGKIFVQNANNQQSQQYATVTSGQQAFSQSGSGNGYYHLWGMFCSNSAVNQGGGNKGGGQGGDPCSPSNGVVVGYLMAMRQLSSLYGFTTTYGGGQCYGGVLAQVSSNNASLEIDPVLPCSSGVTFNGVYTISWWGLLWFGNNQNADPYSLSPLVENPPQVSVSAS